MQDGMNQSIASHVHQHQALLQGMSLLLFEGGSVAVLRKHNDTNISTHQIYESIKHSLVLLFSSPPFQSSWPPLLHNNIKQSTTLLAAHCHRGPTILPTYLRSKSGGADRSSTRCPLATSTGGRMPSQHCRYPRGVRPRGLLQGPTKRWPCRRSSGLCETEICGRNLSIYLPTHLPTYLLIYLPNYLPIYLSRLYPSYLMLLNIMDRNYKEKVMHC